MHDPEQLPGALEASALLVEALKAEKTIAIYGDYDVDGMTATSILWHVIKAAAPDVDLRYYVPHRLEEGYGLNIEALQQLYADDVDLVITVDCGITAVEQVGAGRALGLDIIVTDHHNLRADGGTYPTTALCGAGVAFKLAWQFGKTWTGTDRVAPAIREALKDVMPLVAMGTIADVMPLTDENRILVRTGLALLGPSKLAGLHQLIESCKLQGTDMNPESVAFRLAPCLNAAGRMGHAADAVELLTTARDERAAEIAESLNRLNLQRRETEKEILEQAIELAEAAGMTRPSRRAGASRLASGRGRHRLLSTGPAIWSAGHSHAGERRSLQGIGPIDSGILRARGTRRLQ